MSEPDLGGRPTIYSEDIAEEVCELIAGGMSLVRICKREEMPSYRSIMRWLETSDGFRQKYEQARADQIHFLAEDIIEISDDDSLDIGFDEEGKPFVRGENIQRSRLRVDSRKWFASKMLPKKYGDKQDLTLSNPEGGPLTFTINLGDAGKRD